MKNASHNMFWTPFFCFSWNFDENYLLLGTLRGDLLGLLDHLLLGDLLGLTGDALLGSHVGNVVVLRERVTVYSTNVQDLKLDHHHLDAQRHRFPSTWAQNIFSFIRDDCIVKIKIQKNTSSFCGSIRIATIRLKIDLSLCLSWLPYAILWLNC